MSASQIVAYLLQDFHVRTQQLKDGTKQTHEIIAVFLGIAKIRLGFGFQNEKSDCNEKRYNNKKKKNESRVANESKRRGTAPRHGKRTFPE